MVLHESSSRNLTASEQPKLKIHVTLPPNYTSMAIKKLTILFMIQWGLWYCRNCSTMHDGSKLVGSGSSGGNGVFWDPMRFQSP